MDPARDAVAARARVLVVGADEALIGLLEEWLDARGWRVAASHGPGGGSFDVIVVDLPFPRQDGIHRLRRISEHHPGTPLIALSSNFFAGVDAAGAVAKALGVARVLPKPVTQEALLRAVDSLLAQ
ncbi:MAG: response regulator [Pseudomonadota bacterium]